MDINTHIENDLYGGLPLSYPEYYTENNEEYITSLINPYNLKVYVSTDEFKIKVPKYSEKGKELEKLIDIRILVKSNTTDEQTRQTNKHSHSASI